MEKIDARTLSQEAQYQIRRQVVKLRKRGMKYEDIGEVVGITATYACRYTSDMSVMEQEQSPKGREEGGQGSS